MLGSMSEGVLVIGHDMTVRLTNEQTRAMLALSSDCCVGRPIDSLGVPRLSTTIASALEHGTASCTSFSVEMRDYTCTVTPYSEGGESGVIVLINDTSEWAQSRCRWDAIGSSMHDGLVVFDTDNRITFVNPIAEELLGQTASALVGTVTDTWALLGLCPETCTLTAGHCHQREVHVSEPVPRIIDARVSPVIDKHGVRLGIVATLRDVTSEREAARMKDEFVSTVSHELRTPLTSIKGYIDLLLEGEAGSLDDLQHEFLSIVKQNSDRLVELINDMLDVSRIESGRVVMKIGPLSIHDLVNSALAGFRATLEVQDRTIMLDIPADLPPAAGDPDRVRQVLINYLGNAIKYSPNGGPIEVRAEVTDSAIRVSITDHGIGIAAAAQSRLFQQFYRVDSTLTREIGGTGLGLSICKSIISLLGGQVGVSSAEGTGSTFWFTLPIATPALVRTPTLEVAGVPAGAHVLVVDESVEIADLIENYLLQHGYRVTKAHDVDTAWEAALTLRPQVITLDVMLDDEAGFGLLARIKSDPRTRDVPVAVLSIICDEAKACGMGATGYLEKPIDRTRLVGMIDGLVGSVASPKVLIVDDDRDIVDVLTRTLKGRGYAIMAAFDGREAMAAIDRTVPDAILLDLRMPVMDGYEVLEALRSEPRTHGIPVIVMTAYHIDEERAHLLELATTCLSKPLEADVFVSRIDELLASGSV